MKKEDSITHMEAELCPIAPKTLEFIQQSLKYNEVTTLGIFCADGKILKVQILIARFIFVRLSTRLAIIPKRLSHCPIAFLL